MTSNLDSVTFEGSRTGGDSCSDRLFGDTTHDASTVGLLGGGGAWLSGGAALSSLGAGWGGSGDDNNGGDILTDARLYDYDGAATFWCGEAGCAP